jgi:hypothetical protein
VPEILIEHVLIRQVSRCVDISVPGVTFLSESEEYGAAPEFIDFEFPSFGLAQTHAARWNHGLDKTYYLSRLLTATANTMLTPSSVVSSFFN